MESIIFVLVILAACPNPDLNIGRDFVITGTKKQSVASI